MASASLGYGDFDDGQLDLDDPPPIQVAPSPSVSAIDEFDDGEFVVQDLPTAPTHTPTPAPVSAHPSLNAPHAPSDDDDGYGGTTGESEEFGGGASDLFEIEDIGGDSAGGVAGPPAASQGLALALIDKVNEQEEFDPDELDQVSGFGPIPSSPVDVIKYTLRVRKRSAELVTEAERIGSGMSQAKKELDDVLARLGERAQVAGFDSPQVSKLLEEVASADVQASNAQEALSVERRRHQTKIAEIDKVLEGFRAQMAQPRRREAKLAGQLGAKQEEARQLELRIQRLDIEFRNAEALITRHENEAANPEGTPDAELARKAQAIRAKLPGIKAQREELSALRKQMEGPIEELTKALGQVRESLSQLRQKRIAVTTKREEEDTLHVQNTKRASSQTAEASKTAKSKLAQIGRTIRLEGDDSPPWAVELFDEIDVKAKTVHGLLVDARMHKLAAETFDPSTVKKGYLFMGAGVGLALLVLLALLILVSSLG